MIVKSIAYVHDPSPIGVVTPCRFTHDAAKPLAAGGRVGENTRLENFRGDEPASRRMATVSA
jgi:hypothetical protein